MSGCYSVMHNMCTFTLLTIVYLLYIPTLVCVQEYIGKVPNGSRPFFVFWNVPTEVCHKYGYKFDYLQDIGITQNSGDSFIGNKIVIMYDPGAFPAIINGQKRNGGVPQEGKINLHIQLFTTEIKSKIPNMDFDGVGIIDFEHWRPIWNENWGKLDIYRQKSKEIERKKHPFWSDSAIEKEAIRKFEKYAFLYMNETLSVAKSLRPNAKWGYYAYPYCFNYTPKNSKMQCIMETKKNNDRSSWMYETSTALYPSVYLQQKTLNEIKRARQIQGKTEEGVRIAKKGRPELEVIPYTWFKYQDTRSFLSKEDMTSSILVPQKTGASGIVIWGSSNDVNSEIKCSQLDKYTKEVIRPILKYGNVTLKPKGSSNEVFSNN